MQGNSARWRIVIATACCGVFYITIFLNKRLLLMILFAKYPGMRHGKHNDSAGPLILNGGMWPACLMGGLGPDKIGQ